jgi:hypothetical protein
VPQKRVFSEQEAAAIIRRAAEITEAAGAHDYMAGVTATELERIAAEVGISPQALAQALSEASTEKYGRKGPFHLTEEFERVVDGEVDPDQYDLIVEGLKIMNNRGAQQVAQVGRSLTMTTWTGVGQAHVEVSSRKGRTRLKVKSNALIQGLMTLHPAFMASLITIGAMSEQGMGWLAAGIAAGIMTVGGLAFRALTKLGHRRAEELADTLEARIAEHAEPASEVASVQPAAEPLEQRLGQG